MFYLVQLGTLIKRGVIPYLLNLCLAVSLLVSIAHFDHFNHRFIEVLPKELSSNYFHALISDSQNVSRIARKMRRLPGVESVVQTSRDELHRQVKERIKSLAFSIPSELMSASFQGLKVIFETGVGERSMSLIRNYLTRLVGTESVTIGDIHLEGEKDQEIGLLLHYLKRWSGFILLAIVGIFWAISLQLLARRTWRLAYILEQYQRRRLVAIKLITLHGVITLCIALGFILPMGTPATLNILILVVISALGSLLQLRRVEWTSL
jgi:hypothetical protein